MRYIMSNSHDIWIFAEQENGNLNSVVLELIAKAHELKALFGGNVVSVLLGSDTDGIAEQLSAYRSEKVIVVKDPKLKHYSPRPYAKVLSKLAEIYSPQIFMFSGTEIGRELAPLTMCRLRTGLTADVIEMSRDEDGTFIQTTPRLSGSVIANICIQEKRPQMVTVRPRIFTPFDADYSRKAEIIYEIIAVESDEEYEVIKTVPKSNQERPIKDAKIVVSVGRGLKSEEDIELAKKFSDCINGQLACSRPIADTGMLPRDRQIGQTGSVVKADYIFNFGISGSTQYMAGMQSSRCVMSVNTNPDADIFSISHFGIVKDYRSVMRALLLEIEKRKLAKG